MKKTLINLLNRISKFLHIPADKIAHFGVNLLLAAAGFFKFWLAFGLCIGSSCGKELGDAMAKGNKWDWGDIIADVIGMIVGLGIVVLIGGFRG